MYKGKNFRNTTRLIRASFNFFTKLQIKLVTKKGDLFTNKFSLVFFSSQLYNSFASRILPAKKEVH